MDAPCTPTVREQLHFLVLDQLPLTDVFMLLAVDRILRARACARLDDTRHARVTAYFSFSPKAKAVVVVIPLLVDDSLEEFKTRMREELLERFPIHPSCPPCPPCHRPTDYVALRPPRPRDDPSVPDEDVLFRLFHIDEPVSDLNELGEYDWDLKYESDYLVLDPDSDSFEDPYHDYVAFATVQAKASAARCNNLIVVMNDPDHEHEWDYTHSTRGHTTYTQRSMCSAITAK